MPDQYDLTDVQRADWGARLNARLPGGSDTALATKMQLRTDARTDGPRVFKSAKTVAGYLGELRRGRRRALVYFFGSETRLEALAGLCNGGRQGLLADLAAVRAGVTAGGPTVSLPGFEHLGPMPMASAYVLPPIYDVTGTRVDAEALRKRLQAKAWIRVSGRGAADVVRWLGTQAREAGWPTESWSGAPPTEARVVVLAPAGRADLASELVGQDPAGSAGKARRWFRVTPEGPRWLSGERVLIEFAPGDLRVGSMDAEWVAEVWATAARLDTGTRTALPDGAADVPPGLGPAGAGAWLRSLADGGAGLDARSGVRMVVDLARRRLQAVQKPVRGLALAESLLPALAADLDDDPGLDVHAWMDDRVETQVSAMVDNLSLTKAQREVLEAALPLVRSREVTTALFDSGLLRRTTAGIVVEHEGLLAPALAELAITERARLRRALVTRQHDVLWAVSQADGGIEALAAAMEDLSAPVLWMLARDLAPLDAPGRHAAAWLVRVPSTPRMVARWIAVAELSGMAVRRRGQLSAKVKAYDGAGEAMLKKVVGEGHPLRQPLWPCLWGVLREAPAPDDVVLVDEWSKCADELGLSAVETVTVLDRSAKRPYTRKAGDPLVLIHQSCATAFLRAWHLGTVPDLMDSSVWAVLPPDLRTMDERCWPQPWVLAARDEPEVVRAVWQTVRWGARQGNETHIRVVPGGAVLQHADVLAECVAADALALLPVLQSSVVSTEDPEDYDRRHARTTPAGDDASLRALCNDDIFTAVRRHPAVKAAAMAWAEAATQGTLTPALERHELAGVEVLLRSLTSTDRGRLVWRSPGVLGALAAEAVDAGIPVSARRELTAALQGPDLRWEDGQRVVPEEPARPFNQITTGNRLVMLVAALMRRMGEDIGTQLPLPGVDASGNVEPRLAGLLEETRTGRAALWWIQHHTGSPELLRRLLTHRRHMRLFREGREAFGLGKGRALLKPLRGDREFVQRLVDEAAPMPVSHWRAVLHAALNVELDAECLWVLLSSECRPSADAILALKRSKRDECIDGLVDALVLLAQQSRRSVLDWLERSAAWAAPLLDDVALVEWWRELAPSERLLEHLIAVHPGEDVGGGLVGAVLDREPGHLSSLLERPKTRVAALERMLSTNALRREAVEVLRGRDSIPVDTVLKRVFKASKSEGLTLLDEASRSWPRAQQVALWRSVVRVASGVRSAAWARLARLDSTD